MVNIIICFSLFIVSIIVTAVMTVLFYRRPKKERASSIGISVIFFLITELLYLLNFLGLDTELKQRIVLNANWLLLCTYDVTIVFALDYVFHEYDLLKKKSIKFIRSFVFIYGGIDCLFLLSNMLPVSLNFAIKPEVVNFINSGSIVIKGYLAKGGFWYTPHFIFVYGCVICGIILFAQKVFSLPKMYTLRYFAFIISGAALLLINFFLRLSKFDDIIDMSMPFISMIIVSIYKIKYDDKPLLMLVATQGTIFNRMEDPILLFDNKGILVNYNEEAERIFGHYKEGIKKISLKDFLAIHLEMQVAVKDKNFVEEVKVFVPPADRKLYKLEYNIIRDKKRRVIGTFLIFNDITILTKKYQGLDGFNTVDEITALPTNIILQREMTEINLFNRFPYSATACDISGLKLIEQGLSRNFAQDTLRFVASVIRSSFPADHFVSYSNGCFYILSPTNDREELTNIMESVKERLSTENPFDFPVNVSFGIAHRRSPNEDFQNVINSAENELYENKMVESTQNHQALLENIQKILNAYEKENDENIERELVLANRLGKELKLSDEEMNKLNLLVKVHDIGKLTVPENLVITRDSITQEEKTLLSIHTVKSSKIASMCKEYKDIEKEILCHHEWYNGEGYPNGFKGEQIPYLSRILSVVEAYNELIHERVYHTSVSSDEALYEIDRCAGVQFDPQIAAVFVNMMKNNKDN